MNKGKNIEMNRSLIEVMGDLEAEGEEVGIETKEERSIVINIEKEVVGMKKLKIELLVWQKEELGRLDVLSCQNKK